MSKTYRRQSSDKFERSQRKSQNRIPSKNNINYEEEELFDDDLEDLENGYINRIYANTP